MKIYKLILISISNILLWSATCAQENTGNVKITAVVGYSSGRIYRGAPIWKGPVIFVGPSFTFYNFLTLGKGGISLFKKINKEQTIRIGTSFFDDSKPSFPAIALGGDSVADFKNDRHSTYGTWLSYNYRSRVYGAASVSYHKDLKSHFGHYLLARFSVPIPIFPLISIGTAFGFGNRSHNKYVYGPEAVGGLAHINGFIGIMLPFLPWKGRLMVNLTHSHIAKPVNNSADDVRGNGDNIRLAAFAIWNL